MIATTSLMLNKNGSAYHLQALPENIAETVLLVGDPNRTRVVAQHFDRTEVEISHRGFVLKTGYIGKNRLTVIGTGIGSSNIDIVINELDMLVNIDIESQQPKPNHTTLDIIRLGTSGALQADIPSGSLLLAEYAFAMDGLLNYYQRPAASEDLLQQALKSHFHELPMVSNLYVAEANSTLLNKLKSLGQRGITFTCCGFYGPQSRQLRAPLMTHNILELSAQFNFNNHRVTNFEMETAAIYGLGEILGHRCCSINAIVDNRITDEKYPHVAEFIEKMVSDALNLILAE